MSYLFSLYWKLQVFQWLLFTEISTQSRGSHEKSEDLPWTSSSWRSPHSPEALIGSPRTSHQLPLYKHIYRVQRISWKVPCRTSHEFPFRGDIHTVQKISLEVPGPPMSFLFMEISTQPIASYGNSQDLPWVSSSLISPHSPGVLIKSPWTSYIYEFLVSRGSHSQKFQDLLWASCMKFVPLHSPKDVTGSLIHSQCNISIACEKHTGQF